MDDVLMYDCKYLFCLDNASMPHWSTDFKPSTNKSTFSTCLGRVQFTAQCPLPQLQKILFFD